MAYVTLEDDTASIEMLAFSNVISQYGNYLRENAPVVIVGRVSMRDDKEPQIVVNRARPMSDFAMENPILDDMPKPQLPKNSTLYLRLATKDDKLFGKIRAILGMFPGDQQVVVYFADTKERLGSSSTIDSRMVEELTRVLGQENVVVK